MNTYEKLYIEYMKCLINEHPDFMTRKQIKEKDRIDIRPIFPPKNKYDITSDHDILRHISQAKPKYRTLGTKYSHSIFDIIPCFKEGTFYHDDDKYIYWLIKDINTDANTMDIFIQYYNKEPYQIWQPKASGVISYGINEQGQRIIYVKKSEEKNLLLPTNMRYEYSLSNLTWTSEEKNVWTNFIKPINEKSLQEQGYDFIKNATIFTQYVYMVNQLLSQEKIKTQPSKNTTAKIKSNYETTTNVTPRKRKLDILDITSVKPPKRANAEIIRTYRLPSWKTRGHVRHYKSGKTVYIKESIHHRKKLQQTDTVPQTIITLKGE